MVIIQPPETATEQKASSGIGAEANDNQVNDNKKQRAPHLPDQPATGPPKSTPHNPDKDTVAQQNSTKPRKD